MRDSRWRLGAVTLLVLGLALACRELGVAPLEYHESYVVETAQEMREQSSWIVPWFNAQPRLQKPPLSYWATALTGRLSGHDRLQPVDGRLPSALAGAGILVLVLWIGARVCDRRTALLAGAMLITTAGFFHYTHSARSDMLYAFWAMAGLAAFVVSTDRAERGRGTRGSALVMWGCFGLGTLTKGPQVPAMFLAAFGVWAATERVGWRRALETIRPFSGVALLLALTVPWWLAVEQSAAVTGLSGTQLGGSLLRPGWFAPDYLYRIPQLLIPWSLLIPTLTLLAWRDPVEGRATRLLGYVVAVTFVAFSLGSQQRAFYVLPLLGPAVLLLAAGTWRVVMKEEERPRLRRLIGWTTRGWTSVALAGLAALVVLSRRPTGLPPGTTLPIALAGLVALAAGTLLVRSRAACGMEGIVALASLTYGTFWLLGGPALDWTRSRDGAERFGRLAAAETPLDRDILAWDAFPDPFVYYAGRPIRELTEVEQVLGELGRSPQGLVLLAKTSALDELPPTVRLEVLYHQTSYRGRDLSLVRLILPAAWPDAARRGGEHARVAHPPGSAKASS